MFWARPNDVPFRKLAWLVESRVEPHWLLQLSHLAVSSNLHPWGEHTHPLWSHYGELWLFREALPDLPGLPKPCLQPELAGERIGILAVWKAPAIRNIWRLHAIFMSLALLEQLHVRFIRYIYIYAERDTYIFNIYIYIYVYTYFLIVARGQTMWKCL